MNRFDILGEKDAVEKVTQFIYSAESTPKWNDWYVGITADPIKRLYEEHKASPTKSIYVFVDSAATARSIEILLINHYGMDGRPGGGEHPRFVYAFKKLRDTDPPL